MDRNELRMQIENNAIISGYIRNVLHNLEVIMKEKPNAEIPMVKFIDETIGKTYRDIFTKLEADLAGPIEPKVEDISEDKE